MKNLILILLIIGAVATLSAQLPTSAAAYDAVVDDLQVLSTTYSSSTHLDPGKVEIERNGSEMITMIGAVVSSELIIKELSKEVVHDYAAVKDSFFSSIPALKKLNIYCDSFVLNSSIRIPSCDVYIHARSVNMNGKVLSTSPFPYKPPSISLKETKEKGEAGQNAGDITIVAEKCERPGFLEAIGSQGENHFAPTVSIEWMKTKKSRNIYEGHGCVKLDRNSQLKKFDENKNVVGVAVGSFYDKNKGSLFWPTIMVLCTGNESFDDKITIQKKGGITDSYGKRLKSTGAITQKGGNGGTVKVFFPRKINGLKIINNGGAMGDYLKPDIIESDPAVTYVGQATVTDFNIETKQYSVAHFKQANALIGVKFTLRDHEPVATVPSAEEINSFKEKYLNADRNSSKNGGKETETNYAYVPHYAYLKQVISVLEKNMAIYDKLPSEVKKSDNAIMDKLVSDMQLLMQDDAPWGNGIGTLPAYLKEVYGSKNEDRVSGRVADLLINAQNLQQKKFANLDAYNNPPGFRPMLSIQNTISYLDGNMREDIKMFVLADLALRDEKNKGLFLGQIDSLVNIVKKNTQKLEKRIGETDVEYTGLQKDAKEIKRVTKDLKKDFEQLKKKLKARAREQEEKRKIEAGILKTAALAASLIPYGQPALAEIGGKALNAMADYRLNDGDGYEAAVQLFTDIDMEKMAQSYADNKILQIPTPEKRTPIGETLKIAEFGVPETFADIQKMEAVLEVRKAEKENKKAMAAYEKQQGAILKKKKNFAKAAKFAQGTVNNIRSLSVNAKDVDRAFAKLAAFNSEYQELVGQLRRQAELKENFFRDLTALIQESQGLSSQIAENMMMVNELVAFKLNGNGYDQDTESLYANLKADAMDRLKWMEYQLLKSYEYTTLRTFDSDLPTESIFEKRYNSLYQSRLSKLDNSTEAGNAAIDRVVDQLAREYKGKRKVINQQILANLTTGYRQDSERGGRQIVLYPGNPEGISAKKLAELNAAKERNKPGQKNTNFKGKTVIDLQADLVDVVIKPDEAESRIKNIVLKEIELEEPLPIGANLQITFELAENGIFRTGNNDFYYFKNETGNGVADRWKWSITGNGEISNTSELSQRYVKLIEFLTENKPTIKSHSENNHPFTYPPAWTKAYVKLDYSGQYNGKLQPKIKKLVFNVVCNYLEVSPYSGKTSKPQFVFDLKQKNNPSSSPLTIAYGGTERVATANYYGVIPGGTRVELKVEPAYQPLFKHWTISGGDILGDGDREQPEITVAVTDDMLVEANYYSSLEEKEQSTLVTAAAPINVYDGPTEDAGIIDRIASSDEVTVLNEPAEDGFVKVLLELQYGYVRSMDLKK